MAGVDAVLRRFRRFDIHVVYRFVGSAAGSASASSTAAGCSTLPRLYCLPVFGCWLRGFLRGQCESLRSRDVSSLGDLDLLLADWAVLGPRRVWSSTCRTAVSALILRFGAFFIVMFSRRAESAPSCVTADSGNMSVSIAVVTLLKLRSFSERLIWIVPVLPDKAVSA